MSMQQTRWGAPPSLSCVLACLSTKSHVRVIIMRFLIYYCIQDGWAALHFSAWAGRLEVLEELLKHGADVNLRDKVCSLFNRRSVVVCFYRHNRYMLKRLTALSWLPSGWKDSLTFGSTQGPSRGCGRSLRSWRAGECGR